PDDGHVDAVVFRDQHPQVIEPLELLDLFVVDIEFGILVDLHLDRKIKRASFPFLTLDLQLAAEKTDELAADGETQTRAAILAGGVGIGLCETLEDLLL